MTFIKFPRTRHIEGSLLQQGDLPDVMAIKDLRGLRLSIAEKLDGANSGFSFDAQGQPLLQSRGEYLRGGPRERHFDMFKTWVFTHASRFHEILSDRYIVYGEWLYAKHTIFYDALPHYFMEFDIYDRRAEKFLSKTARQDLLAGLPIVSVPILFEGELRSLEQLQSMTRPTPFKSDKWQKSLEAATQQSGSRLDMVLDQTEDTDLAEGLYLKHEVGDFVEARYKFVRAGFMQALEASDSHWKDRPLLPNQLAPGVDMFASET